MIKIDGQDQIFWRCNHLLEYLNYVFKGVPFLRSFQMVPMIYIGVSFQWKLSTYTGTLFMIFAKFTVIMV